MNERLKGTLESLFQKVPPRDCLHSVGKMGPMPLLSTRVWTEGTGRRSRGWLWRHPWCTQC